MTKQHGSIDETLAYFRREPTAALEGVPDENDFLYPSTQRPDGLENETWWFTFEVPEHKLEGAVYLWMHSKLNTATGFVLFFKGVKRYVWQAEHFNCFNYLPWPEVNENRVSLPELGVCLEIVKPHTHHVISYDDPRTGTTLRMTAEALLPAVKAVGRSHLEQPMHVTGELTLDGQTTRIDCYSMRDRSWRGKRSEAAAIHPPSTYSNGISDDGSLVFNFNGADDPDRGEDWREAYPISKEDALLEGWVHREGTLAKVVAMSKQTTLDPADFMRQTAWECTLTDELGRETLIRAERVAALPFSPWSSIWNDYGRFHFVTDDDRTGSAVTNDFFFNPHARTIPMSSVGS